jgi:hypothetical protein
LRGKQQRYETRGGKRGELNWSKGLMEGKKSENSDEGQRCEHFHEMGSKKKKT